jgi:MGT family glycosyltransferase
VILWSSRALVGDAPLPPRTTLVGPAIGSRREVPFPWDRLADRPRVLVSLGTVSAEVGARFFGVAIEAVLAAGAQPIVAADPTDAPPAGDAIVQRFVPQLDLLAHVDAVIGHGGHNTVVESLAHGRPMVLAPIRDDQPIIADQVVRGGAGVRVKFARVVVPELTEAVRKALGDPAMRAAAGEVARAFAAAGGPNAAAAVVREVASGD